MRRWMAWALVALGMVHAANSQSVNVDRNGLALEGHDPVAFHTEGRAAKGEKSITAAHKGATYRFASEANKKLFEQNAAKYAPAYGGYCGYGVAKGQKAPVAIDTWQIVDDRLILNYDEGIKKKFDEDKAGNIRKADANWPSLAAGRKK